LCSFVGARDLILIYQNIGINVTDIDDETVIYCKFDDNFSSCALLCNNNGGFQRKGVTLCVGSRLLAVSYQIWRLQLPMQDLEVHAEDKLKYYIRMDLSTFEELFILVE